MENVKELIGLLSLLIVVGGIFFGRAYLADRRSQENEKIRGEMLKDIFRSGRREDLVEDGGETSGKTVETDEVRECLLLFFEEVGISRYILKLLATSNTSMSVEELTPALNNMPERRREPPVQADVVRKISIILANARIIRPRDGMLVCTKGGRALFDVLLARRD